MDIKSTGLTWLNLFSLFYTIAIEAISIIVCSDYLNLTPKRILSLTR